MFRKEKTHSPRESLDFNNQVSAGGAPFLPIIVGQEALRPILSQGLLFSQLFFLALSECVGQTFRTILLSIENNGRIHNLLIFQNYYRLRKSIFRHARIFGRTEKSMLQP